MAAGNFPACLRIVLVHEGGWSNHPDDPGGATMRGVIQRTYDAYRRRKNYPLQSVRLISEAEIEEIYRSGYWDAVGAESLPAGVDLAVFDPAVNSGPARARHWYAENRKPGPVETIRAICDARMSFLRGLRHWRSFGRGWSRRVADIRAKGEAMARGAGSQAALHTEAARARETSRREAGRAGRTATTGAAIAPAAPMAAATGMDPGLWIFAGIMVAAIGVVAFVLWRRSAYQSDVAAAYEAEAMR